MNIIVPVNKTIGKKFSIIGYIIHCISKMHNDYEKSFF